MSYFGGSKRQLASAHDVQSSFLPPGPGKSAVLSGSWLEQEHLHVTNIVPTLRSAVGD